MDVTGHARRGMVSSVEKEVGLMEWRFQPDLFERGHVGAEAGPISIRISLLGNEMLGRFATRTDQ
jgi:hypothetical protein